VGEQGLEMLLDRAAREWDNGGNFSIEVSHVAHHGGSKMINGWFIDFIVMRSSCVHGQLDITISDSKSALSDVKRGFRNRIKNCPDETKLSPGQNCACRQSQKVGDQRKNLTFRPFPDYISMK
jgi:hypothetical protein